MAQELTKKEIYERIKEWRNLKKLHATARDMIERLKEMVKLQNERINVLEKQNKLQTQLIEKQALQLEELRTMVFGKKKKKKSQDQEDDDNEQRPRKKADRTPDSYQRRTPKDEEVTDTQFHTIDTCPECKNPLEKLETRIFHEEDIVLPHTTNTPLKTVIQHKVERGWCKKCRTWRTAIPLPSASVILGKHIKLYLCYLSILIRLSFEQIITHLKITYDFDISDGEISTILEKEARTLIPEYEAIKDRIRQQKGVHYDETSWKVQKEERGNYIWTITGTETNEVAYLCGESRGGGVVDILRGENTEHVGITDGYGGYHNKFTKHQLCWAHPHRKLRDLKDSDTVPSTTREHCHSVFEAFTQLYHEVDITRQTPFILSERLRKKEELTRIFDAIIAPHPDDPEKLIKIKQHLREKRELYFTCITNEGIPPDNNKAERSLRHLIIKRKISFGSKTQRGAETLSILASVLLSLWWMKPKNFFRELMEVRGV